jgi:hypothetical protein
MSLKFIRPSSLPNENNLQSGFNSIMKYHSNFIDLKVIDEKDVNDIDKTYYLLYPVQGQISPKIKNNHQILSETIIQKLGKGYDIRVYYCTEAECEFESIFDDFKSYCESNKIPTSKIYLASGNSKLENLDTYGINLIRDFNAIIHRMCITLNFNKDKDLVEWNGDKKYLFQCYNNMMKGHRVLLLTLLQDSGLLSNIDWSAMRTCDLYKHEEQGFHVIRDIFELDKFNFDMESFYHIVNGGKSKYSEYEDEYIRNPNAQGEPDHNITYKENPYKNAYINIVNESQFELKNTIHITEKSLVPFHFNQIPLFVATQGHVKKLKELYGFDVFDDLIDHSYDDIENPEDRINYIVNEIKRLNSKKDDVIKFYIENKTRFDSNREIIHKISNIPAYQLIIDKIIKL